MNNNCKHYTEITREILDTIKVGDQVKINDWENFMRVKGVSTNFFVMTCQEGEVAHYSVCSKLPWNGIRHNAMIGGMFHCGGDNWVFGSPLAIDHRDLYQFNDPKMTARYLEDFENEKCEISVRNGTPIVDLYILSE